MCVPGNEDRPLYCLYCLQAVQRGEADCDCAVGGFWRVAQRSTSARRDRVRPQHGTAFARLPFRPHLLLCGMLMSGLVAHISGAHCMGLDHHPAHQLAA